MIKLFPEYPESYYRYAIKYRDEKKYDKSIEYAKQAIEKYEKIEKLNYWYIGTEQKKHYIMDANKLIIYNYLDNNKVSEAVNYFVINAYPNMKKNNYKYLEEIFLSIVSKNEELYKEKNIKEYNKNLLRLKEVEMMRVMIIEPYNTIK